MIDPRTDSGRVYRVAKLEGGQGAKVMREGCARPEDDRGCFGAEDRRCGSKIGDVGGSFGPRASPV